MYLIRRYDWALHLLVIAVCAYFLAKTVATYMSAVLESLPSTVVVEKKTPDAPVVGEESALEKEGGVEAYAAILERNIFNSSESGVAAGPIEDEEGMVQQWTDLGPAIATNLDIKLLGTLVIGEGVDRRSSAIISGTTSKKPLVYYPGSGEEESFAPNTRLTKVSKDRIEFVNGSRLEYVELQDFVTKKNVFASVQEVHGKDTPLVEGGEKTEEKATLAVGESKKIVLDQKEVDETLQNLDKLYSDVRIVPHFKDGKASGMKVLSIKPGSVMAKLGLKRGDILERVNGQELDVKRGVELFTSMKDMKTFSLDVVRGGKSQTLEYEIR